MSDLNNFFKELKKRKVFRSLAFYAGASFIILQVCSIVFPALLLPDWSMRLVVVLLIIGFPTLIIFSWIYDVTPEGVIKTDKEKSSGSTNYSTIILILVIAGGLLFYFQDRFFKPEVNPKSVAVLPFDASAVGLQPLLPMLPLTAVVGAVASSVVGPPTQ